MLEQEAQALLELERRSKEFPGYFYDPCSKSAQDFHLSRSRLRILSGGNRSGKTETGSEEIADYALGYRPWVLRQLGLGPPDKPWIRPDNLPPSALCVNGIGVRVPVPNTIFVVTGQSMKKGIGETIEPKLRKLLGPFIADSHMAHSGVPADLILKNGSKIVFGSAEQGPQAFESTNYTATAIDEPIPRRIYTGIARGSVDQFAPIWMTFTPIGAWSGWIFKDLYSKAMRGKTDALEAFNMSIYDNKFLTKEAIDAFANDPAISDVEKEARLYGRFMHLVDRVYANFDDRVHVIPPVFIPRDWYCGMAVDPHSIRPWAIAYFAVSPNGDIYIFKEWPTSDITRIRRDPRSIEEYALLIRQLDGDLSIHTRLMDPNYGPRKDTLRGVYVPSIVSDIARFGLHFHHHLNDDLAYGEAKVRSLLAYNPDRPLDSMNRPGLYVTEDCPNVISALNFYTTKPKANSDGEVDDDKREETYKDFADVVRYIAVSHIGSSAAEQDFQIPYDNSAPDPYMGVTGYGF